MTEIIPHARVRSGNGLHARVAFSAYAGPAAPSSVNYAGPVAPSSVKCTVPNCGSTRR